MGRTCHRMEENRYAKQALFGEMASGKRRHGRSRLRYKDPIKARSNECDIPANCFEEHAKDRDKWRRLAKEGSERWPLRRVEERK